MLVSQQMNIQEKITVTKKSETNQTVSTSQAQPANLQFLYCRAPLQVFKLKPTGNTYTVCAIDSVLLMCVFQLLLEKD